MMKRQPHKVVLRTYSKEKSTVSLTESDDANGTGYSSSLFSCSSVNNDVSNLGQSLQADNSYETASFSNLGNSLLYAHSCSDACRSFDSSDKETTHLSNLGDSLLHGSLSQHDSLDTSNIDRVCNNQSTIVSSTPKKNAGESSLLVYQFPEDDDDLSPIKNTGQLFEDTGHLSEDEDNESSVLLPQDKSASLSEGLPSTLQSSFCDLESFQQVQARSTESSQFANLGRSKNRSLWKFVKAASIERCKKQSCCEAMCLMSIPSKEIEISRFRYWTMCRRDRKQFILHKLLRRRKTNSQMFVLDDVDTQAAVCQKAFMAIFSISKNHYYSVHHQAESCVSVVVAPEKRGHSQKYVIAMNWLEEYASCHGDRMPDNGKIMLPYKTRKTVVYQQYKEEHAADHIHVTTFMAMWRQQFSHLRVKKINSFSKCTTCTSIERQLEQTFDIRKREKLFQLRADHNSLQMGERKYYYKKRDDAKKRPDKFLSLIIDGMDQSKTNLPHFVGRMAKAVNPSDQLGTHITGVIAHGQSRFYTYLDLNEFPHDSNLTINLLLRTLLRISQDLNSKLPPTCYIQCDNCWRENKNKYMLGFCELLVRCRIFNEVHLSFLMVGHTHEDIDAAFSKIADTLRRKDAETLPELRELLPNVQDVLEVLNVRDWLEPYLNDIKRHTKPLHFKFWWNFSTKKVEVLYKGKHSEPWKSLETTVVVKPPRTKPQSVLPNYENIHIDRIESHLGHWDCLFSDQLHKTERAWWKAFVSITKQKMSAARVDRCSQWIFPLLPRQPLQAPEEPVDIPEAIVQRLHTEQEIPEVQVRRRPVK